jgi:serine/threonine-protein kinase
MNTSCPSIAASGDEVSQNRRSASMKLQQLGPYRLGKKLGQGGMGSVYEGVDVETGEPAAVKVLTPILAAEEGFRVRFEAEIDSLKKLRHPNIVRLYGYGEQEGTLFYAMELVHGTSLEDELRAGRRFDWREVTAMAIKLCRALKHAHDHGVIHRDLKPANLLLTPDGDVKLSDFGIARLFGNTRLTADGGVLGTAEYMAPEQADGRAVTERCDQYSLGGVMYALLAGRPPFRAKTMVEMLQLQRYAEPEPVTRYAPQTPAELARIIHQMLEKDPQRRFANVLILARSLEAMERGLSVSMSRGGDFVLAPDERSASLSSLGPQPATLSPEELAPSAAAGHAGASEIEATEATVAFGSPEQKASLPLPPAADAQEAEGKRFTKVEPEQDWRATEPAEAGAGLLSPQTLLLVLSLALLLAAGWYLMQPPSADKLYDQIEQAAAEGNLETMRASMPKIEMFLEHYGHDPRADQVRALAEEARQTHPAQRAFTEAKRLALVYPELAAEKLRALIDVYDDGKETPESVRRVVRQSEQKLKQLREQIAERADDDREMVASRLARAAGMAADRPSEARRIYQGVVTLYRDKSWAGELVQKARTALEAMDHPQAAKE